MWGMGMQFVFALIILRTSQGFVTFKFIGETITRFLEYTDVGSAFVLGDNFAEHYIAFKVRLIDAQYIHPIAHISINLLASYHQRRSLIGYAIHYLFCCR